MAKDPDTGSTEATTLIFPKKSAWEELVSARAQAKKRAQSANGTYSKVLARLVEEEHMDRRAARILLVLDGIEDPEDLHVTFHHLMDGIAKLKLDERAMAQPNMFTAPTPSTAAAGAKNAKGKGKGKKDAEPDMTNVTAIGEAARKVTEAAGAAPVA
jgi:uncharacterized protein YfaP (DUF2135 family)